jgi:signal transduction histidine kinase
MHLFRSATLRLTAWYMLVLTILCLLFSVIVFQIADHELNRPFSPGQGPDRVLIMSEDTFETIRSERAAAGRRSLLQNLAFFNIAVLASGGLASYLLARRTLLPIANAMEAQSRFSSDAAHELRTPLAIMQSEIEVALRGSRPSGKTLKNTLTSNLDEVHRLRALTDRLLLLSSEKKLELAPTTLEDIAIDAVGNVIPLAQAKQIAVENTVGDIPVTANRESLTDALTVLLDNAIKYSPEKSVIRLYAEARPRSKFVTLSVADQGGGIPKADQPRIFDRFYRADTSRSRQHVEGHGLGLSIAKRIIDAHHGSIALDKSDSTGSVFTIQLPKS